MKRKNGILYTLLITVCVYTILTWILPVTTFNGEFAMNYYHILLIHSITLFISLFI